METRLLSASHEVRPKDRGPRTGPSQSQEALQGQRCRDSQGAPGAVPKQGLDSAATFSARGPPPAWRVQGPGASGPAELQEGLPAAAQRQSVPVSSSSCLCLRACLHLCTPPVLPPVARPPQQSGCWAIRGQGVSRGATPQRAPGHLPRAPQLGAAPGGRVPARVFSPGLLRGRPLP